MDNFGSLIEVIVSSEFIKKGHSEKRKSSKMKALFFIFFRAFFAETQIYSKAGLVEILQNKEVIISNGVKRTRITVINDYKPPGSSF